MKMADIGTAMLRHLRRLLNLIVLSAIAVGLGTLGCLKEDGEVHDWGELTNLVIQVPERRPAGPWRLLALERRSTLAEENMTGLQIIGDAVIQRSEGTRIVLDRAVRRGEALLFTATYDKRWVPDSADRRAPGSLEVRICRNAEVVAAVRRPIRGWSSEVTLESPSADAATIELRFDVPTGEELPLNSIAAVAIPLEAPLRERARARAYLAWAARDHAHHSLAGLQKARVAISLKGCSRDALTLVDGDTLSFDLPSARQGFNLMFWVGGVRTLPNVISKLELEGETGSGWRSLRGGDKLLIPSFEWSSRITIPIPGDCTRIRFAYSGAKEVVALGMPHLKAVAKGSRAKPNVVLVDLDTMRADRLNCYGYAERATSTILDAYLNEKGFYVFSNAYSAGSWTLPATAKFLCSRYHGFGLGSHVNQSYTTLAEFLRDHGFYCIAFTGGGYLRVPGFEQGFHEYYWTEKYGKVEETFAPAMKWLRTEPIEPFFLFVHTYEPHTPFTRDTFCRDLPRGRLGDISRGEMLFPEDFSITTQVTKEESLFIQAAYDGGVKKACDTTAELFALMDSLALWDNTVVAILSDHGEEFWDHSASFAAHRYTSLYGELLNVPFMIYAPEKRGGGMKIIETQVTTVDLMPTIAQLIKVKEPEACDGISLYPQMSGRPAERTVPILALNWPDERMSEHDRRSCVYANGVKYIEQLGRHTDPQTLSRLGGYPSAATELYVLGEDPREQSNVVHVETASAIAMAVALRRGLEMSLAPEHLASAEEPAVTRSLSLRRQLEALGYVEGE
jgi:arylsulfatase A-like enzyme